MSWPSPDTVGRKAPPPQSGEWRGTFESERKVERNRDSPTRARPPLGAGRAGARRCRPLPLREAMYRRVLELRAQGLSYSQIIERIREEFGEELSKSQVSEWVRGLHRPDGKVRYELKICPELGWVLAVLIGDGKKKFKHGGKYYDIEVEARPELVELFAQTVPKVVGRDPPSVRPAGRGLVSASFQSVRLYCLLSDFRRLRETVESSLEVAAAFLSGLSDAEACISKRVLRLYNSDFMLLLYAQKLLSKFSIETTGPYLSIRAGTKFRDSKNGEVYEAKKDVYYIYIRAKSLRTFYERVGFKLPRKRRRLEEAIGLP